MQPIDDSPIIIPILRYRDGAIAYDRLGNGNGMIILGAVINRAFHQLVKLPTESSGSTGSQGTYVVVQDVDAHYAQAIGAGAEITIDLNDDEHGGRSYSCRDLQGHIWNFGSYDPGQYFDNIFPID
jgi:uncharacterized glyoxalase superfamily protein PhnB